MEEFKGTKGQWFNSYGEIISMPNQTKIAKVSGESYEEIKANSLLISAAPDLLKALDDLLDELSDQSLESSTNMYLTNAKKAINKALGL